MADGINSVTGAALDAAPLRAAAKVADNNKAPAFTADSTAAQPAISAQTPISPRLQTDYLTGTIVTEYVGSDGQVTLQLPSAAALAYLRAGLTADGQPLPKAEVAGAKPEVQSAQVSAQAAAAEEAKQADA